jgi:hypothetical protein
MVMLTAPKNNPAAHAYRTPIKQAILGTGEAAAAVFRAAASP